MPKKSYKLIRFDGGLNVNSSDKDLAENQLAECTNVSVDKVGQVYALGQINSGLTVALATETPAITAGGYGFYIIHTDKNNFGVNPNTASGAAVNASEKYYIIESASGVIIEEATDGDTLLTASIPAILYAYFHNGALRIFDADLEQSTVAQWRGFIPGQLYGNNETGVSIARQGHIYNSGGGDSGIDQWYTKPQAIEGCFPTITLPGTLDMQVCNNAIMWQRKLFEGGLNTFLTAGEPWAGPGFANEKSAIIAGTTPPGDVVTESGMSWGFSLGYHEYADETGGWMPTGIEQYQFYVSTVYDGIQESLPQLMRMYPSGPQFSGTLSQFPSNPTNTYESENPVRALKFGNGILTDTTTGNENDTWGSISNNGQRVKMLFDPSIKMHGLQHPAGVATGWDDAGDTIQTRLTADTAGYNFGATGVNDIIGGNPRITGIKVYWSSDEDGFVDLWQLFEWDFVKGVKAVGSDSSGGAYNRVDYTHLGPNGYLWNTTAPSTAKYVWPPGTVNGPVYPYQYTHTHGRPSSGATKAYGLDFHSPPRFLRYDAINGHSRDDIIKLDSFKTSAFAAGSIYAGNVKIDGVSYGDRMVKSGFSLYGPTPDKFPVKANNVDIAVQDGDDIVKLMAFGDRLFQFKRHTLYIYNVSGGQEFVERKYDYKGIPNAGAACVTDFGIAWANMNGVYLHNGQKIEHLLEPKGMRVIDSVTWKAFADTNPGSLRIGFNPLKRQLIVRSGITATNSAYIYDMATASWTLKSDGIQTDADSLCPMVTDTVDGQLVMIDEGAKIVYAFAEADGNQDIGFTTKEIDFGEPSVKKTISKVFVTYKKGHAATAMNYLTDGDKDWAGSAKNFDESSVLDHTADTFVTESFSPATSAQAKNIYSIQIRISGTMDKDFVLNDITIVYKMKSIK